MKNVKDPDRLRSLLGAAPLARLRARLRARLGQTGKLDGRISLRDPSPDERAATDALFGRRPRAGHLTVDLGELERVLQNARIAETLVAAVEALEGPILAGRDATRAREAAWAHLEIFMASKAQSASWAAAWTADLVSTGLLRRLSRGEPAEARTWFEQALALLVRLPIRPIRIAELAADVCGDAHGFDEGEPLGTLVARGIEHVLGLVGAALPRRTLLAKAGILSDDLSAPVLVLNLRATSTGLLAETLNQWADAGQPLHLCARQLQQERLTFGYGPSDVVFACENPTIVAAAADRLGAACRPLLCTSGQARTAVRELLSQLKNAGARVLYHGDFDWPGVTIARGLLQREEAEPWRLGTKDYEAAPAGPPLEGKPTNTPWDPRLSLAMRKRGVAVHEEAVLDALLADLGVAPSKSASTTLLR